MSSTALKDLKNEISRGNVVFLVGAGCSISAVPEEQRHIAGWEGLIEHGLKHCYDVQAASVSQSWLDRALGDLKSHDLDDMLSAAEKLCRKLKKGEFRRWLEESIGQLKLSDKSVLDALISFNLPIITTNYDNLLCECSGLQYVTHQDPIGIQNILRGNDDRRIIHLHGHYRNKDSVVLSISSYQDLLGEQAVQSIQQALRTMKTLIFVGFGEGLKDPNFSKLFQWSRDVFKGEETARHYRLCLGKHLEDCRSHHPAEDRVFVLSYGEDYSDLAPFLRSLLDEEKEKALDFRRGEDFLQSFNWADLRDVILHLKSILNVHDFAPLLNISPSKEDLEFVDLEDKNKINKMDPKYFDYISTEHQRYFSKIKDFLTNPSNEKVKDAFFEIADEFKARHASARTPDVGIHRDFMRFCDYATNTNVDGVSNQKKIIRIILSFMYFECLIGDKK